MDYLPSSFFKRLLRYVISRFELIDSSALDLDSLGVRWGHQSTVEFRDLDLRLEKLASLLHLPPSSRLLSARVRLLRIIIPTATDFYKRSVIVQASGIEVHIRLPSEEGCPGKDGQPSSQQAELDPILPNPADLAESFLETEPLEEKEELQAAIESRSQVLQRTTGSLSDDEEELGLGNEDMSLPSFLAGFFKGVAERLQVQVDDIAIRLDVETKQDGTSKRQPEDRPDLVTGLVTVGQVKVDAVVMPSAEDPAPPQQGKRLVSVSDINLDMISEPIVFANYSRFTAPPASPSTPVQSKPSPPPSRGSSPPPDDSSNSSSALAMTQSTIFERPQDLTQSVTQERTVPEMERSTYTYDGRFSDAASDDGHPYYGYLEDSQNLAYDDDILDNPGYLDSAIRSQLQDDDVESPEHFAPHGNHSLTNRDGTPRLDTHGTRIASLQDSYTDESTGRSPSPEAGVSLRGHYLLGPETEAHEPAPSESQLYQHSQSKDSPNNLASSHLSEPASETASSGSTSSSYKDTGLSESRLFSNEEAQSMYMSAFSHGNTAKSFMPNMPGAWDSPEETIGDASVHGQSGGSRNWHETSRNDDDPDETGISTPKLTAQSESQIMHGHAHGSQRAQSEATDRESSQSSPGLNRISDVAKRLFSVDKVLIWVSEGEASDEPAENPTPQGYERSRGDSLDSTVNLQESIATGDLLASGMQSSTRFRSDSVDPSVSPDTKPSSPQVSIEIFAVECQIDLATGWLAVKVGQRILSAFTPADGTPKKKTPSEATPSKQSFGISLDKLSIKFVEHIPAHNRSPEDSQQAFFGMLHQDIILQATASGLQSAFSEDGNLTKFRLDISKFALGFATEDLISFSEDLKMRESTRDVLSPVRGDLSLSLSKSSESARVSLTTLPLQVNLNVPRLEEALEWLGGLSTILELGNSISSASGTKGTKKTPPKRARGVHFEAAAPPAVASQSDSVPWKVDVRLGGIALDLAGEAHYLKLRTTAVKAVSRFEGVAIQIDKAKINGPIPLDDEKDAPAKMNLSNIRVEYLYTPKETDLARLLSLITPSQDKYDEEDDIMVDTLLRQRKQGSVLRVNVGGTKLTVSRTADLDSLSQLGDEIGRLSNVAKYLPEDDRPGIMTLALIRDFEAHVHVGGKVGDITARLKNAEGAFVSIPSLVAAQFASISVLRNQDEELLGEALIPDLQSTIQSPHPVLMARYIADEMEPTIKVKLHHLRVEYTVPALIAFLGLGDDVTTGNVAANMAHSIADIAEIQPSPQTTPSSKPSSPKENDKPIKLGVALRDCVVGLNPRGTNAKGLLVLTNSKFSGAIHDPASSEAVLDLRKASLMVIDDVQNVESAENIRRVSGSQINQIQCFIDQGFVPVSTISSATATLKIMQLSDDGTKSLDVELKDDLLILETCADSTQTLINIVNGLQPPAPPIVATKYRTEVLPIQDMLASLSGDAFEAETASDPDGGSQSFAVSEEFDDQGKHIEDEVEYVSDFDPLKQGAEPDFAHDGMAGSTNNLLDSFHSQYYVSSSISDLDIQEDHFANRSSVGGTAHRWDSARNTYGLPDDSKLQKSPLRIRVRDAHVIWNLFDGYDWQRTRDTISKAVKDVEKKATERRARPGGGASPGFEEDEESVIGDCLFNSIYIGIPANKDPRELRNDINRNIDDLMSETGSYATTTTVTGATARRQSQSPSHRKKLRLSRSKYHKMTFELKGICADLVVFPPDSGETQSSLDVRVNDLEIFDHVPTSTWKKFATFMHEAGEKETGTNMVHLEILTVRPVPDLAASEIVLKATLLPLRLHVDQDALDFLSRFFEFRDESAPAPSAPGDIPFLQRVEVNAVPVKLDFKPKRVDYAGLRSGRTTEFMNFFVLDGADMVMRRVILYGVAGFDKLGKSLNDIWMPDIKRNQLPSVLAGLAPIRSLVNVGGGVKDLVVIPMREYRKDGRLVRSIQKGAVSFAKTTSNELVKLGAKLAIGTQTVLQGAEEMLNNPTPPVVYPDEEPSDEEEAKKISLYAEQPVGVVQGLRGAYRGLERDLILARDAIVAVPGEVVESGSARAAAKAVWKHTPTVVLRPAIGVSKAVGQTLLGAGNTLDPSNRRKMEDKYKRH